MRRSFLALAVAAVFGGTLLASPALGHFKKCPRDSVQTGPICMDTYEASAWRVPDPTGSNRGLGFDTAGRGGH